MILAINSSTIQYGIALMTLQGVIVAEYTVTPDGNTFTEFMPALDRLLASSGTDSKSISVVAAAAGPGSFTGLRVGLSVAKGVAYSMNIPLTGISGTEALAFSIPYTDVPVCAMITSRRDEVFYAFFKRGEDDNLIRQSEDKSVRIEKIGALIGEPTILVGNDFQKQKSIIEETGNRYIIYARPDHWNLRASSVGILGLRRFYDNDFDDIMDIVPDYQRPPDIRPNK